MFASYAIRRSSRRAARNAIPARHVAVWLSVAAIAVGCIGLACLAPFAWAHGHAQLAFIIYQGFSRACHQMPSRSFYFAGHPLAVCARCSGLYAGFTLGAILYPLARSLRRTDAPARVWLFIGAAPVAIDWTLGLLRLWTNTHLSRFATGALCGAVCAFYVVPGLIDLSETIRRRRTAVLHHDESCAVDI